MVGGVAAGRRWRPPGGLGRRRTPGGLGRAEALPLVVRWRLLPPGAREDALGAVTTEPPGGRCLPGGGNNRAKASSRQRTGAVPSAMGRRRCPRSGEAEMQTSRPQGGCVPWSRTGADEVLLAAAPAGRRRRPAGRRRRRRCGRCHRPGQAERRAIARARRSAVGGGTKPPSHPRPGGVPLAPAGGTTHGWAESLSSRQPRRRRPGVRCLPGGSDGWSNASAPAGRTTPFYLRRRRR